MRSSMQEFNSNLASFQGDVGDKLEDVTRSMSNLSIGILSFLLFPDKPRSGSSRFS